MNYHAHKTSLIICVWDACTTLSRRFTGHLTNLYAVPTHIDQHIMKDQKTTVNVRLGDNIKIVHSTQCKQSLKTLEPNNTQNKQPILKMIHHMTTVS